MNKFIIKLINTTVNTFQTHLYFNMYMSRSVFFRCAIIDLKLSQEKKLIKVYKTLISKKLELSKKFPWSLLYTYKLVLCRNNETKYHSRHVKGKVIFSK